MKIKTEKKEHEKEKKEHSFMSSMQAGRQITKPNSNLFVQAS